MRAVLWLSLVVIILALLSPVPQVNGDTFKKLMKSGLPLALLAAPLALGLNRNHGGDEKPYTHAMPPPPPLPPQIRIITVPQPIPVPVPVHHHHRSIVKHHHHKGKTKIVHVPKPVKKKHKFIIEDHHDFDKHGGFDFDHGLDFKHDLHQPLIAHGEKIDLSSLGHGFSFDQAGGNVKLAEGGYHISKGELSSATQEFGHSHGHHQALDHGHIQGLSNSHGHAHHIDVSARSSGHADLSDIGKAPSHATQASNNVEQKYQRQPAENITTRRGARLHRPVKIAHKENASSGGYQKQSSGTAKKKSW